MVLTVLSGLTKKQWFCSWLAAQDFSASYFSFWHLPDVLYIVNAVHFLKCKFFPFYVIMFLSVQGSDEEKIIIIIIITYFYLINRLFCIEICAKTRFANFLPTVLKTWTPCKHCK